MAVSVSNYTAGRMFSFLWQIDRDQISYAYGYSEPIMYFDELKSTFDDLDGKQWKLTLTANTNTGKAIISIALVSAHKSEVNVMFSLDVYKGSEIIGSINSESPVDFAQPTLRGNTIEIHLRKLVDSDEQLAIVYAMYFIDSAASKLNAISNDFDKLFISGNHSDVILAVDGQEIKAHKAILSARSEVFAAMFEHKMMENKTNRVIVNDIAADVLKEMLRFIYTGNSPNINEMAADLLAAADKYDLIDLKNMCADKLMKNTTVERALEDMVLADRYNVTELKAHMINFINSNAAAVIKTKGWQNIRESHAHLIFDIYEHLISATFSDFKF